MMPCTVPIRYKGVRSPVFMGKGADKLMWLDFIQIPMNDVD